MVILAWCLHDLFCLGALDLHQIRIWIRRIDLRRCASCVPSFYRFANHEPSQYLSVSTLWAHMLHWACVRKASMLLTWVFNNYSVHLSPRASSSKAMSSWKKRRTSNHKNDHAAPRWRCDLKITSLPDVLMLLHGIATYSCSVGFSFTGGRCLWGQSSERIWKDNISQRFYGILYALAASISGTEHELFKSLKLANPRWKLHI